MKWFAGLGKNLGRLLTRDDSYAIDRQHLEHVVTIGLARILGKPATPETLQNVLQGQRTIDIIYRQIRENQAPSQVHYDGLSQLKPLQEAKQGYLLVYVQGFLTEVLQHLIGQGGSRPIANVVFKLHEDPSAHISVLERGHGLAFELPFFPVDDDHAMLCDFFGELASVSLKAAAFAVRTQAPVLPIWGRLVEGQGLSLEIAPPMTGHTSPESLALALLEHFERRIRSNPEEMDWEADCWYPPSRRLLPSRYPWKLELSSEDILLKPLRLLVRVPDTIREACLAVPSVRALKRGRPDTRLTVLTTREMEPFWDLLEECDATLNLDVEPDAGVTYDLGILLNESKPSLTQLKRFPVNRTLAMETHPAAGHVDDILTMPRKLGPPEHRHRTYLRVAHRLGAEVIHDLHLRRPLAPLPSPGKAKTEPAKKAQPARAQKKSRGGGKRASKPTAKNPTLPLGMVPYADDGAAYAWPAERFLEVVRQTAEGHQFAWRIFLKADSDPAPWEAVVAELPNHEITLVQSASALPDRLADLAACRVILANDSDDLHLAATVHGIPTIAIYGPSDPNQTAPVGHNALVLRRHVECTPCFLEECPLDHRCLNEISVAEVIEALKVSLSQISSDEAGAS